MWSHPNKEFLQPTQMLQERVKSIDCTENKLHIVRENSDSVVVEMNSKNLPVMSLVEIFSPLPVRAVSCGKEHTLLLSKLGTVMSYGAGRSVTLFTTICCFSWQISNQDI